MDNAIPPFVRNPFSGPTPARFQALYATLENHTLTTFRKPPLNLTSASAGVAREVRATRHIGAIRSQKRKRIVSFLKSAAPQRVKDSCNTSYPCKIHPVDGTNCVGFAVITQEGTNACVWRLPREVRRVVRDLQEKGLVCMAFYKSDGFGRKQIVAYTPALLTIRSL